MVKVLVTDPIHESAITKLRERGFEVDVKLGLGKEELKRSVGDYDVIVVRSRTKVDREVIDEGKKLKLIARAGVGLDNIDVEYAKSKGIDVINTPEGPTRSVAELVIGYIFTFFRKLVRADNSMKKGLWMKKEFLGEEVLGKTIGVIGFGRIGREISKLASSMGLKVLAYDKVEFPESFFSELGAKKCSLEDVLRNSDILTLHLPLTDETRGFLSRERISMMKDGALLINTSRGAIVDEEALLDALKRGKISGACLDVYSEEPPTKKVLREIIEMENVIATPHIGASTKQAQKRCGEIIAQKIIEYFENGKI
ncbi:MAG: D-2-hydroxyacid dehydrogenase [Candidatus Asgardarchaeia archaeon]